MSAEGFARDHAWSVFEALRPGPGQTVEKVAVVTYSLDLVAVAGLLLSLGTSGEDEFQAGPLEFADAVRALKDRLVIIHQKGRLKTPTRYRDILHILDGTVRSTNPERSASWHPKAILAKYADPPGGVSWRLWLGSRNLTGSRDREAGLLLSPQLENRVHRLEPAPSCATSSPKPTSPPKTSSAWTKSAGLPQQGCAFADCIGDRSVRLARLSPHCLEPNHCSPSRPSSIPKGLTACRPPRSESC